MADKRVTIQCRNYKLNVLRVTGVDIDRPVDTNVEATFDEPVPVPASDGGFKIDMSLLEARNVDEFITLKRILKLMESVEGELSVYEEIHHKTGDFLVENHFGGVLISGNKVKVAPKDLTARDLSFIASTMTEKVNGKEI